KLCVDNNTRWTSTIEMISQFVELAPELRELPNYLHRIKELTNYSKKKIRRAADAASAEKVEVYCCLLKLLHPVQKLITRLQTSSKPTAHIIASHISEIKDKSTALFDEQFCETDSIPQNPNRDLL